jgi:hypothetical protein
MTDLFKNVDADLDDNDKGVMARRNSGKAV